MRGSHGRFYMLLWVVVLLPSLADCSAATVAAGSQSGFASWYGPAHRGRLMANGKKFDPDKFTAASWFYPLGTKLRVTLNSHSEPPRSVLVIITDRGPALDLVRHGRIIDLSRAPFKKLAAPDQGLVAVKIEPLGQAPRKAPFK